MTVNRLSGNRVLIILDGDDMRTLSLDIDSIGGKDSPSMRALSNLSRTACRRGGIRAEGRSLTVEALSFGSSCYLLVTVGGKKYLRKTATLCYRGAYYLVLSYPALPKRARVLLSEYNASRCRGLTAAFLGERGKALCPRCAVQTVGRHFVN